MKEPQQKFGVTAWGAETNVSLPSGSSSIAPSVLGWSADSELSRCRPATHFHHMSLPLHHHHSGTKSNIPVKQLQSLLTASTRGHLAQHLVGLSIAATHHCVTRPKARPMAGMLHHLDDAPVPFVDPSMTAPILLNADTRNSGEESSDHERTIFSANRKTSQGSSISGRALH